MNFFKKMEKSSFPVLVSCIMFMCMVSSVKYLFLQEEVSVWNKYSVFFLMLFLVLCMVLWFSLITHEGFNGAHNSFMKKIFQVGMMLFMLSEVMFFFGFFWAFFHNAAKPLSWEKKNMWPPLNMIDSFTMPLLKTLLLVSSSFTVTLVHGGMEEKKEEFCSAYSSSISMKKKNYGLKGFFLGTIFLGMMFEVFQLIEFIENCFSLKTGVYGTSFYMLTGFHGFHVLLGLVILTSSWCRWSLQSGVPQTSLGLEKSLHFLFGVWYWHFVDVVWLFLFTFLYYCYQ